MKNEKDYINTKMMLETIRSFKSSGGGKSLLNEMELGMSGIDFTEKPEKKEEEPKKQKESIAITNDPKFGQNVLKTQQEAFQNAVNAGAEFPGEFPLVYFPDDGNIVFSGTIPSINNLKFQYKLRTEEGFGVFVWVDGMAINAETLKILNKLYGYYLNWRDEWQKEAKNLENLKID
jgi:hypothetical protein